MKSEMGMVAPAKEERLRSLMKRGRCVRRRDMQPGGVSRWI